MTDNPLHHHLHLLLADGRTGEPCLSGGLDRDLSRHGPLPEMGPDPENLWSDWSDPNDLERQRWGVIAPLGPEGDELIARIQPLIDRRRAQQGGAEVKIHRIPHSTETGASMTLAEAARWKKTYFNRSQDLVNDLPRYQLILGDLHQVPLSIQQVQSSDGFVGRIAFDEPEQYRAYVDKILRWEDRPAPDTKGDAILYTVQDRTPETSAGHACLMAPGMTILRRGRENQQVRATALHGMEYPSREEFWKAAATRRPSVLFTMSHGAGMPEDGWHDPAERRREQGALCFGPAGCITGKDLVDKVIVPGGFWFMFACFGAGTPASSAYRHWLEYLSREFPAYRSKVECVMRSLSPPGRPFIAALPKAALASPQGPLAFIGHVDLAWSFSFQDIDTDVPVRRPGRFMKVIQSMLDGARVGAGFFTLGRSLGEVETELVALYDEEMAENASYKQLARRGHLWMLHQDLAGYVLLGDPAVQLPLTRPTAQPGRA